MNREERLDRELRFHMDQHVASLIAKGCDPDEARRLARIELGGPAQVKEECRDVRPTRWLEDLWQDTTYALRTLRQKPGFTVVALLTLALGIGATTVMFTVINGVLLKPLPYVETDRLVNIQEKTDWSTRMGDLWAFTYPNFLDCKQASHSLTMAASLYNGGTISQPGDAQYVEGREISWDLFPVLGIAPFRGRGFLSEEDRVGAPPVAMIGYDLWQRTFVGNPAAIGMPVVFNEKSYTVVGILPPGFRLFDSQVDVFTLLGQDRSPRFQNRQAHGLQVWGRLRPGATIAQAQAELDAVGRRLAAEFPRSNKGRGFLAEVLRPDVGDVRSTLWLLLGAVSLVLLIACVNIASLLLARSASRERELAMRVALGAGRGRLVRQGLTESAVLGLGGGAIGILLAAVGLRPFVSFWPGTMPRAQEIQLDWRVLAFAIGVSLLSAVFFGLAPALRAPSRNLEQALRAGARTVAGSSRRLHGAFVISEIALAVVLLIAAGMLGRTMLRLASLDTGVKVHGVLTARMALSPATLSNPARTRVAWQEILESAHRVPGVEAIAMVDTVPMREGNNQIGYRTSAAPLPDDQQPATLATSVSPEYLKVMGIRLLEGRFFDDQDRMGAESVVVVDDAMARQAFPGEDAVGKHVWIGIAPDPARVVGVVGHVRYWGPAGDDQANKVRAQLYYPFAQVPDEYVRRWSELMSIAVRTSTDPLTLVASLRREVRGATNDQVIYEVRTMEQLAANSLGRQRFLLLLFGLFAGLALLLACIGIYGVLSYLTNERVPEIGVRMALGASGIEVMLMVLRQSLAMIFAGVLVGVAAAMGAGRVLIRLVDGMRATELSTVVIPAAFLVAAALFASFLPARRASRVDPMKALRQD